MNDDWWILTLLAIVIIGAAAFGYFLVSIIEAIAQRLEFLMETMRKKK